MFKWILAIIGFAVFRFPGGLIGYFIGTLIDNIYFGNSNNAQSRTSPFQTQRTRVDLGDFELNLLSLSALVIKADGEISQRELDYVRAYFVQQFGKERANATFRTFNEISKKRSIEAHRIAAYLRSRTSYEMRLQILHFLFGVANADGRVYDTEINMLNRISGYLNINPYDFISIKAMFVQSANNDNSYQILEVDKNASEAEIKKAYREMVKKYHPDKLVDMDEAYKKGAREKFDKVQEAYDKIRQEKGF